MSTDSTNRNVLPNDEFDDTFMSENQSDNEPSSLCLSVFVGDRAYTYDIPTDRPLVMGRSSSCDVQLDDPSVSRIHASILAKNGVVLRDEGSSNGTRVNDIEIPPHTWTPVPIGSTFNVGALMLIVRPKQSANRPRSIIDESQLRLRLDQEHARCIRRGTEFALLRFRIAPDLSSSAVENGCAALLRAADVFGHYGSRQYAVLLLDVGPEHAVAAAGRIMSSLIADLHCEASDLPHAVVCFPRDAQSPDDLLRLADGVLNGVSSVNATVTALASWNKGLQGELSRIATSDLSVLLIGETGVGKEVFASLLHEMSPRADNKMVRLNCAAIAENLLEAELFGFEKGAFTGADRAKPGLLESAEKGTVFLDEIGEMPLSTQVKLLRVLETREVQRIGALEPRSIDVRFLAATNRDLEAEVVAKRFRRDLLFRINAVTLQIPPLRERSDEIEPLSRHFAGEVANRMDTPVPAITDPALHELRSYSWPGNVRELRNVIERAVVLSAGTAIKPEHLPLRKFRETVLSGATDRVPEPDEDFGQRITRRFSPVELEAEEARERQRIIEALEECGGNQTQAARLLGVSRGTLVSRLDRYDIPRPRKRRRR